MKSYSAVNFALGMELEKFILRQVTQTQKDKRHVLSSDAPTSKSDVSIHWDVINCRKSHWSREHNREGKCSAQASWVGTWAAGGGKYRSGLITRRVTEDILMSHTIDYLNQSI
jgi:GH24 family phage-related lysozyme (muramidase)